MKTILLLGVLFLTSIFTDQSRAGGSAVGNGGFGVFRGKYIYLYDLVEAGIIPQRRRLPPPAVPFSTGLKNISKYLGVREDLLTSQLHELDNLQPRLGRMLENVIQFYRWEFSTRIAGRTKDVCPGCFQIAVRTMDSITIDASLWKHMDQENRIALILHEVIFAVMRNDICPVRENKIACDESHFKGIREIVALIFSAQPFHEKRSKLGDIIPGRLSLGWSIWRDDFRRDHLRLGHPDKEKVENFARRLCGVDPKKMSQIHRFPMIIPFEIEDTIYGPQYFLKFLGRSSRKVLRPLIADPRCAEKVASLLMTWFSDPSH